MRFGRRPRSRGQVHAVNTSNAVQNHGGAVASEERSALIGAPISLYETSTPKPEMDTSDATQQLLTSLGRFQRELTNAADSAHDGWADEGMNQLIDCVEVALPRGWSEMVEALTDTGRILQTYENAGRPRDCVDFLNEAYEMLCLMVGDLMVDSVRPAVMKQWRERYQQAVAELEREGLVLVTDEGDAGPPPQVVPFRSRTEQPGAEPDLPFELPEAAAAPFEDEQLPTLEELPPLEAILNGTSEPEAPEMPAPEAETAPEPPAKPAGPSRLVVEILDQLCEQLAIIEEGDAEAAAYALDRFSGGLRALEREAHDDGHEPAVELCGLMVRAARLARMPSGGFRDGLSELGYAFCGAYMDALREEDSDSVSAWRTECEGLLTQWEAPEESDNGAAPAAPALDEAPVEEELVEAAAADAAPEPESPAETAVATASPEEPVAPEIEAAAPAPTEPREPEAAAAVEESEAEAEIDETSSEGLLEAARRAAMKGDATGAKRYALQAAGAIARDEVKAAEAALTQTKGRLKNSLEAMREAREYVGETEASVQDIAAKVKEGEIALGKAREHSGLIEQQLSDLREGVAEIERQIAELQAKREEELKKVAQTDEQLTDAHQRVAETESELAERRAAEAAARTDLETRRQTVNDLQRTTGEIESEVDDANRLLDEKQKSFDDITEAIRQICGDAQAEPRDEGLLF